jgi:hypothetical protein
MSAPDGRSFCNIIVIAWRLGWGGTAYEATGTDSITCMMIAHVDDAYTEKWHVAHVPGYVWVLDPSRPAQCRIGD